MATTPAAGNLDERLEQQLTALVFDEWELEDFMKLGLPSYIEAIKQAFKDAGWIEPTEFKEIHDEIIGIRDELNGYLRSRGSKD